MSLDNNFQDNINKILQNLNKNSNILNNDIDNLTILLIEIKKYEEKGVDITAIIEIIQNNINDITEFLHNFHNNLKLINDKLNTNMLKFTNNTELIIKKEKKSNKCCCFSFLL
jgi:hypothetical protein